VSSGPSRPREAPASHPRDKRATTRKFIAFAREYGAGYATLALMHKAAQWVPTRIDDRLLAIEGRRGSLGPAHRRWTQHSVATNREVWSGWAWGGGGEEWTASSAWKASLIEHLLKPSIPAGGTVVEIGPGAGRWTETLHNRADRLILVDITDTTLDLCRERLGDPPNVRYVRSDGSSLRGIESGSVDAIWAYDTFVHIAPLDIASYLADIARVLRPAGTATIHHANHRRGTSWRSPMTAALFANLAREHGLTVVRQFDSWDGGRFGVDRQGDVITQLAREL
jgi:ubiquinone/menaquinone biosynthesis C-methylase UbiE